MPDYQKMPGRSIPARQEQGAEMSRSRKEVLADALMAEVGAASVDLKTLFTDDVTGWSPYVTLSGLAAAR